MSDLEHFQNLEKELVSQLKQCRSIEIELTMKLNNIRIILEYMRQKEGDSHESTKKDL